MRDRDTDYHGGRERKRYGKSGRRARESSAALPCRGLLAENDFLTSHTVFVAR